MDNSEGWVCSSCARTNHGCVMGEPPAECRDTMASGGSSSDPSTDGSSDPTSITMTDTGDTPCDPECGDDRPYCVDMQCVACGDVGGDEFCAVLDPDEPQCHPAWGHCVPCYAGESPVCDADEQFCDDAFACSGCTEHSQCPDSACDLETGLCMDDATQLWVDKDGCEARPMGTPESPYCNIADAMAVIGVGDPRAVIHLAATGVPYSESILWEEPCDTDRTLAILGFGGTPALQGDPNVAQVACGNTLYLSNVRLITGTATGAYCDAARLWIDDSILRYNEVGIDAVGCRVHVRRSDIRISRSFGIRTGNESDLWLHSSIISGGGDAAETTRAIQATSGSLDIRFTTVANNLGSSKPSFWCAGSPTGTVRNSIFVAPGGSSVDCPFLDFVTSALDDEALAMDGTGNTYVLYLDDWFVDPDAEDYRLIDDGLSPFEDKGVWESGDPRIDIDGDARPDVPGALSWLGADVP